MSLVNPFELGPTGLLAWGLVAHAIADFWLQNDWMANHKALRGGWPRRAPRRRARDAGEDPTQLLAERMQAHRVAAEPERPARWYVRHPAAYVHAGIHLVALGFVFGLVSLPLAVVHLLIDTRTPVVWWSQLIRQTQPAGERALLERKGRATLPRVNIDTVALRSAPLVDIGTIVRLNVDQVAHLQTVALAAILVTVLT